MLEVTFNSILYLSYLFFYWQRRKKVDAGFFVGFVWFLLSLVNLAYYASNPRVWNLSLWPFIYLFLIFVLLTRIYWKNDIGEKNSGYIFESNKLIDVICVLFVIASFISAYYSEFNLNDFILSSLEDNAAERYADAQSGEKVFYHNQLERFAKIYVGYTLNIAIIGMFMYLCQKKYKSAVIMALAVLSSPIIFTITRGNRSILFGNIMLLVAAYCIFQRFLPHKTKRIIYILGGIIVVSLAAVVMAISLSRFGYNGEDGAYDSIFYYFGHNMLVFNQDVCLKLNDIFYGARSFSFSLNLLGIDTENFIKSINTGTTIDGAFATVVGFLLLDFGFLGTFIVALILPAFMRYFIFGKNKRITIAEIYLYLFYTDRCIMGAFYNVPGTDVFYIMALIIYTILRFINPMTKHSQSLQTTTY